MSDWKRRQYNHFDQPGRGFAGTATTSLVQNGTGKWTLTGNVTDPGSTTITQGTLLINGSTKAADLTAVTGALNISNLASPDLVQPGTYTLGDNFTLFAYDGDFAGLAEGQEFTDAGGNWQIACADTCGGLNGGSGASFVTITAVVPEPSAALLGGIGVRLLLRRRR